MEREPSFLSIHLKAFCKDKMTDSKQNHFVFRKVICHRAKITNIYQHCCLETHKGLELRLTGHLLHAGHLPGLSLNLKCLFYFLKNSFEKETVTFTHFTDEKTKSQNKTLIKVL